MPWSGAQAPESTTAQQYRRAGGGGGCFSWRPSGCAASSPSRSASHQPVVSFALFRPLPAGIAQRSTSGIYQFLGAGIDVSIGAAIAASGLLGLKAYRLRVLALIVLNLFLYTTIGFKYRIVVTLIGVFGVWAATRPHKGRPAPRSQRMKVVLAGVAVTTVAFFVVQVYRGNHESSNVVTASSFDIGRLEGIATSSIDIATPYAAIHQQQPGLLLGESYLQLPRLFVPQVITGNKPLPAMTLIDPGGNRPRDRSSGSLVGRGGRQLRSDRASRLWRDPGVGRLTFGHRRPATHGNCHDGSSHRSGARLGAQPLAHVLRSVRVRGDCLSHLDAQPVETSARNPWVLRAAGAGLR